MKITDLTFMLLFLLTSHHPDWMNDWMIDAFSQAYENVYISVTIVKIFNFVIYICSNDIGVAEKKSLKVQVMSHPRKFVLLL